MGPLEVSKKPSVLQVCRSHMLKTTEMCQKRASSLSFMAIETKLDLDYTVDYGVFSVKITKDS